MVNNENKVLPNQRVGKEYQVPELVDLNSIGEAKGTPPPPACYNGSGNSSGCSPGTGPG